MYIKVSVLIVRESYNQMFIYLHPISLTPDAAAGADPDEKKVGRPSARRPTDALTSTYSVGVPADVFAEGAGEVDLQLTIDCLCPKAAEQGVKDHVRQVVRSGFQAHSC